MLHRKRPHHKGKPRVRRAVPRRRGIGNPHRHLTPNVAQFSKIVETVSIQDIVPNQVFNYAFSMNDFSRARLESLNWQFYKAAKVTWAYEPLYNTYTDSGPTALSAPYLYWRMNRTADSFVPSDLFSLQAAGAMGQKLSKRIEITYKPNWNSPGLQYQDTQKLVVDMGSKTEYGFIENSPYSQTQDPLGLVIGNIPNRRSPGVLLPTVGGVVSTVGAQVASRPSWCQYNGHYVYFDQKVANDTPAPIARVTMTVEWHFKGPIWYNKIAQTNTLFNPPPTTDVPLPTVAA